ncbi:MAG: response regulator [Pseudomonadota bacterium]
MATSERVRVVVVDDHRDLADSLVELLLLEGFDAKASYDGREALALLTIFQPHCILFDIAMPGLDGLELARQLRRMHGDDIILLAMTGNVQDARVADAFAVVDHYFAKPFDMADLLKVLGPAR